jgi:hypothetical protein
VNHIKYLANDFIFSDKCLTSESSAPTALWRSGKRYHLIQDGPVVCFEYVEHGHIGPLIDKEEVVGNSPAIAILQRAC